MYSANYTPLLYPLSSCIIHGSSSSSPTTSETHKHTQHTNACIYTELSTCPDFKVVCFVACIRFYRATAEQTSAASLATSLLLYIPGSEQHAFDNHPVHSLVPPFPLFRLYDKISREGETTETKGKKHLSQTSILAPNRLFHLPNRTERNTKVGGFFSPSSSSR